MQESNRVISHQESNKVISQQESNRLISQQESKEHFVTSAMAMQSQTVGNAVQSGALAIADVHGCNSGAPSLPIPPTQI